MLTQTLPHSLTVRHVAELLGVGVATVWRRDAAAMMPRAIRHGRCTRWLSRELLDWLALGCPDRETFEAGRAGSAR
jgi:predicted DNA-binding transcriptional regulator AlpA